MLARLARFKCYGQRAMQYSAFPQAAILLEVWMKMHGWGAWFWPALAAAAGGLLLFGYIERRIGLVAAETEYHWSLSPQLKRILDTLEAKGKEP